MARDDRAQRLPAPRRRAGAVSRVVGEGEVTLVSPGVEETAIGREEAAALYAELEELPEKQREAVVLRDVYGLRYDEVAKALGTSRPAVEALLFRGRRRLPAPSASRPRGRRARRSARRPGVDRLRRPRLCRRRRCPRRGCRRDHGRSPPAREARRGQTAIGIVGSAGVVAERGLHDPPARPAETAVQTRGAPEPAAVVPLPAAAAAAVPSPQPVLVRAPADDPAGDAARAAGRATKRGPGAEDDEDDAEPEDHAGPGGAEDDDRGERSDGSPPRRPSAATRADAAAPSRRALGTGRRCAR